MILAIGMLVLLGIFVGKGMRKFNLPAITGYIVMGIVLGPSVFNVMTPEVAEWLVPFETFALSLIGLSIGGEMMWDVFRRLGKSVAIITVVQMFVTFGAVYGITVLLGAMPALAMLLATLATATAPANTLAVVRQFRARGRVTNTLLGIVALDDAVAVLIFALIATSYENIIQGGGLVLSSLWGPGVEIVGSLMLGALLGFGTVLLRRALHSWEDNLLYGIALACLAGGLASQLGLSVILTTMTAGATAVNLGAESMFRALDDIQIPIFVIFFGLAGAKLDVASVPYIGLVGSGYIVARILGKITGAWLGATLAAAPRVVRQYTGIALLPQAGVAIGLALMAARIAPEFENEILTIMIASTVIFELVGPACTGVALCWAGESSDERDSSCKVREPVAARLED